jgi:SAM-dependent methyltransferase
MNEANFYIPEFMEMGVGSAPPDALAAYYQALITADHVSQILELGPGTGGLTSRLLRKGYEVTAVDKSRSCIEFLKAKLKPSLDKGNLRLVCVDVLDFEDSVVYAGAYAADEFLLHFFMKPDLARFFQRMHELLVVGGRLITDSRIATQTSDRSSFSFPLLKLPERYTTASFVKCDLRHQANPAGFGELICSYEELDPELATVRAYQRTLRYGYQTTEMILEIATTHGFESRVMEETLGYTFFEFIRR